MWSLLGIQPIGLGMFRHLGGDGWYHGAQSASFRKESTVASRLANRLLRQNFFTLLSIPLLFAD
jgi:hypothetical protein